MESPVVSHVALESLEYRDGILLWGGRKVPEIATEIGHTPFYAYDRKRIDQRVAALRVAMPQQLKIHYAMKANPMPAVVGHLAGLVDGLDVASAGELRVARARGVAPRNISFAGPGKLENELSEAILAGITINMESMGEMRRIAQLAENLGKRPSVAIRVNPDFELKTSGMKMGGRASPFGVDAEQVPSMLNELSSLDLDFRGFHVYAGSQNLSAEAIAESVHKTVELILQLASKTALNVGFANLGGGFGIPYFPKERPLDLIRVGECLNSAVERLYTGLSSPEVIIELGRYLVGEAGIYVCQVVDVKTSRGIRYAVCDGGLHHHLAASGNFGQVLRKNYPVASVERPGPATEKVTVVGPLCTPLDILGDSVHLSPVREGSLLAICQSGAYGKSASPLAFLSHPDCSEILL